MFEIRKNLDLRKIFSTPKSFLNRDFTVTVSLALGLDLILFFFLISDCDPLICNDEANNEKRKNDGGDCCLEILVPDKCYHAETCTAGNRQIYIY